MNDVHSFAQLFSERVFRVPDYQRGYSWEARQIRELLEDLETLPPGKDHYTGTLVLLRRADADAIVDAAGNVSFVHDVVDGQQRLTTLVILLSVIARELDGVEEASALRESTRSTYIASEDTLGAPLYKLTLNADSKAFFRKDILGDEAVLAGPTIASHRRLAEAKQAFIAYFGAQKERDPSSYVTFLRNLHRSITAQMKWTLYEVESAADVGIIFEVMNDRGKPLSELDKVKNYLMFVGSKLVDFDHHDLDDEINAAWTQLFTELMGAHLSSTDNEDQLLRAHWLMAYDPQPRKWEGARSVKARLRLTAERDEHPELLAGLSAYARLLSESSVAFADARVPGRAGSFNSYAGTVPRTDIVRWGDRVVRVNVLAPFLPLLMAFRHRGDADGKAYLELLKLAESFTFRVYSLLRRRSDVGQVELFRLANDVYRSKVGVESALQGARQLLLHLCSNAEFEQQLRQERNWYEWGGLVYFLYEYERDLAVAQGAEPDISWQQLRQLDRKETIEHVFPQTPKDPYWVERFTDADTAACTHALGNLSLTKDNSAYGRKPFPAKRGTPGTTNACYLTGVFHMEREIANTFEQWTPESIAIRTGQLTDWALERWHVDDHDLTTGEVDGMLVVEPDLAESEDGEVSIHGSAGGTGVGELPTFSTFVEFVDSVVLPLRDLHTDWARLDGWESGGNWESVGAFECMGEMWKVHADSYFEPLLIAYEAAREGRDPFVISSTKAGTRSLRLADDLDALRASTQFKHLYIYAV